MQTQRAIEVVAAAVMRAAVEKYIEDAWEDYPEIGEQDWLDVWAKAQEIVGGTEVPDDYDAAYGHLAGRDEQWAKENG